MIEIEDVLDAIMQDGFRFGVIALKMTRLMSSFSVAASITRSPSRERRVIGGGRDPRQRRVAIVG